MVVKSSATQEMRSRAPSKHAGHGQWQCSFVLFRFILGSAANVACCRWHVCNQSLTERYRRAISKSASGFNSDVVDLPFLCESFGDADWPHHRLRTRKPKRLSAFDFKLGQSPEVVQSILAQRLPQCAVDPSIYHTSEGYPDKVTALFDVGLGSSNVCRFAAADQIRHFFSLTFAHPSIAASQPLYQINWRRAFPDAGPVPHAKIRYSFDELGPTLSYVWRPTDVREENITLATADSRTSLSVDKHVQRMDTDSPLPLGNQRAFAGGLLDRLRLWCTVCDGDARNIELAFERSEGSVFRFIADYFFVRDNDIGARQDEWNAQWQKVK